MASPADNGPSRSAGIIFSLLLHAAVLFFALFMVTPSKVRLDLDVPVYTVDLLTLAPQAGGGKPGPPPAPVAEPAPEPVAEPAPETEPAPEPEPAPIPEAKPVAKPKPEPAPEPAKPEPKLEAKPAPKAKPEPKPVSPKKVDRPKVVKQEAKPQPTAESVVNQALADVQQREAAARQREAQSVDRELAALREQVGGGLYAVEQGQGEAGGGGAGAARTGLAEVFAAIVGQTIKKNWRWPDYAADRNLEAVVEIELDAAGTIMESRLVEPSGRADFDESCLRAVRETRAVPPPPAKSVFIVAIHFNSQELLN